MDENEFLYSLEFRNRVIQLTKIGVREEIREQVKYFERDLIKVNNQNLKFLDKKYLEYKKELEEIATGLFENADFYKALKKELLGAIKQEFNYILSKEGISDIIKDRVERVVEDNFKDATEKVIDRIFKNIYKKVKSDFEITKKLAYSVDSEIQHLLQKTPTSYNMDKMIKERIFKEIDRMSNTLLLENKKVGVVIE